MAKSTADAVEAQANPGPTAEQMAAATRCVAAVTGCGRIPAERRVRHMGSAKIVQLAECEQAGDRRPAVQMLYR